MPSILPQIPIAIVGISVEIPGGSDATHNLDHKSFFEFLLASGEAYEEMPPDRFNVESWKGTGIGKIHVSKGGFLKDIDVFDNVEFGISSKDAYYMAPAARKLVEHSFLALLDSGIDYRSKRVGVFTSGTSIEITNVSEPDEIDSRGSFAGYPSMVANRISNHLDLLGPSVPIDTACSSTLTAMHLAVQAITSGDCEAAVVGGCQLNHRFIDWFTYSQGSILAKDGKCKPFDSNADGFSRSEACAAVVIKPLEDAIRDQDRIYATILATAINSTGGAAAPGAPVAESQRDAMFQAFARAGRDPREVDYVELHATGTAKGDPTEANWVGECFHREDDLLIGSVKANIGHTEIVAFLASLSKVISMFDQRTIPPQINIKKLNPAIKWRDYRLKVPLTTTQLPVRNQTKALVAISSSGIGGSNGHVVLESPPEGEKDVKIPTVMSDRLVLIMLGGLSSRTVAAIADDIREKLIEYSSDLRRLSTVLGRRSRQGTWRSYGIVGPNSKLLADFTAPVHTPRTPNLMIFVFSGQGSQHIDMGRELFQTFPAFRQSVLEMDAVFERVKGGSIIRDHGLFDKSAAASLPEIWPIALVLPSIAISNGAVRSHAGETSVLYASGAAPKSMAVELGIIRGRSFTPVEELGGTMAALSCTPQELDDLLEDHRRVNPQALVELACYNSPSAVAIAGNDADIDAVMAIAGVRGIFVHKIRTKVPFHSSLMESSKETYSTALGDLFNRYPGVHIPKITTFSTCTGKLFEDTFDAQYYWRNTRSPVQFTQSIQAIGAAYPNTTYVEISPHPVLVPYVETMTSETSTVLHSTQRPRRGAPSMEQIDILHLLAKVASTGYNGINFTALNGRTCSEFSLPLPAYPFAKKKYPLYPDTAGAEKHMEVLRGPLNHPYLRMNKDTHPLLAEHIIRGQPIMPAAAFLEMALEFGASTLINVNFRSMLPLSSAKPVKVSVDLDGAYWSVKSTPSSSPRGATVDDRLHADGYLSFEVPKSVPRLDIESIRNRCEEHIEGGFYPALSYFSAYGPRFQRVTNMYFNTNEALASIKGLDRVLTNDGKYLLHPAVLDACIHVSAYKPFQGDYDPNVYYLPAHIDAFIVHQKLKQCYFLAHIYAHAQLKKWKPDGIIYDVCLVEDSGIPLCTLLGLKVAKHRLNPVTEPSRPLEVIMQPVFHPPRSELVSFSRPDGSSLFSNLDKTTIAQSNTYSIREIERAVDMTQIYCKLCHESWGPDLNSIETKSLPPHEGFQMDQTIQCVLEAFWCALDAFRISSSRVLQLLISSNIKTDHFRLGMEKILQDFPSIYTEIFMDTGNGNAWQTIHPASGIVRNIKLDFENPRWIIEERLFDLALFINVAGGPVTLELIAEAAENVLVPGGICILAGRNLNSWDDHSIGTVWDEAVFGHLQASEAFDLVSYKTALKNFSLIRIHQSENSDPFHFCIEAQKATWSKEAQPDKPLFNEEESFAFHYSPGAELDLQWEFSALNTEENIDVWIMAMGESGMAKGMVRAMQREYVSWTIRLVIFPAFFDDEARVRFLLRLPSELRHEQDIVVSEEHSDILLVPRVVPIQPIELHRTELASPSTTLPVHSMLLKMISFSKQGPVICVLASVVDENATTMERHQLVIGLIEGIVDEFMVVNAAAFSPVPAAFAKHQQIAPVLATGFVSTILAYGLNRFSRPHCLATASRMLLTHADTAVGLSVLKLARLSGIYVTQVRQGASLYDISQLQTEGSFDMILSGYTDRPYVQILRILLKSDTSRLFLWNSDHDGLLETLRQDPHSVGDALSLAFNLITEEDLEATKFPQHMLPLAEVPAKNTPRKQAVAQSVYDPNKTYIILGGIGSLGAHLALFLYERGARHISVTSRSGRKSLNTNSNGVVRGIFDYLDQREDLEISLLAVDATDYVAMSSMISVIGHSNLGGCFLLSAVLSDGTFSNLRETDFVSVYRAKVQPLVILKEVVSLDSLEFVVAFTSLSGIFGIGGQTNYAAANTVLEEEIMLQRNAFSFVCPAVLDSTLVVAGTSEAYKSRLGSIIPWSATCEDVVRWLDDAMYRYQCGQRICRFLLDSDWEVMDRVHGMSRIGKHLVPTTNEVAVTESILDEAEQIARTVKTVLDIPECDFSFEVPLTAYGIDSLSASRLAFLLRPLVQVTQIQLLGDISVSDLIASAQTDSAETLEPAKVPKNGNARTRSEVITDMLAKYVVTDTPPPPPRVQRLTSGLPEVVLLTGTTGNLGSNLLAQLLQADDVKTVYAFNRPSVNGQTSQARHELAFLRQGLSLLLLASSKLVFLEGDLTKHNFGLPSPAFLTLLSSVTHVIHNAWKVDFLSSLDEHEDSVCATRKLLDFALQSSCLFKPSISLISTIGIYQNAKAGATTAFAEESILDPSVTGGLSGYLESKWIAERLVQHTGDAYGLSVNILRVGLLTGGLSGYWDPSQWFPGIVESASYLGCLPDGNDTISWIPINLAASAIIDMRRTDERVLHIIHPKPTKWNTVMKSLSDILNAPLVPYMEWYSRLESCVNDEHEDDLSGQRRRAALRITQFYRMGLNPPKNTESMGLLPIVTFSKGFNASKALKSHSVCSLGSSDAAHWVEYWRRIGFLPPAEDRSAV